MSARAPNKVQKATNDGVSLSSREYRPLRSLDRADHPGIQDPVTLAGRLLCTLEKLPDIFDVEAGWAMIPVHVQLEEHQGHRQGKSLRS